MVGKKCYACKQQLGVSQYVTFVSETWHKECFRCTKCGGALAGAPGGLVHQPGGKKPFHSTCYQEQFGERCRKCGKVIQGGLARWNGGAFHERCMVCRACGAPLVGTTVKEKHGELFCQRDFEAKFCPKCDVCGDIMTGQHLKTANQAFHKECSRQCYACKNYIAASSPALTFFGQTFHSRCFRCGRCSKPLSSQSGELLKRGNLPFHKPCYYEQFGERCGKCGRAIEERSVCWNNRCFHEECLACRTCGKFLAGSVVLEREGNFYCQRDFEQNFCPKCDVCGGVLTGTYMKDGTTSLHKECSRKCYVCKRYIAAGTRTLTFAEETFHAECFQCGKCGDRLGNNAGTLAQRDKKPFHQACYLELFGDHCAKCQKLIKGRLVRYKEGTYHEECLVCHVCGKRLAGTSFHDKMGELYCQRDFEQRFLPSCDECGRVLKGPHVTAAHKKFHKECFRCRKCRRAFENMRFVEDKNGDRLCERCYADLHNPRCSICTKVLRDEFLVNVHGQTFCRKHEGSAPFCSSCERLEPKSKRVMYRDGRIMCSTCQSYAVVKVFELDKMYRELLDYFRSQGYVVGGPPPPIRTTMQPELNKLVTNFMADAQPSGVTRKWEESANGVIKAREVREIVLLDGLPRAHAKAVLAHEFGHVYLFLNGYGKLPNRVEEGICEFFACVWLQSEGTEDAKFRMDKIRNNKNEIYGGGFRDCAAAVRAFGFKRVLALTKQNGRLP